MKKFWLSTAALLLSLVAAAGAQDLINRSDVLSSSDEKYNNTTPIHWYTVTVKEGTRLAIRAASVNFTPTLVLSTGNGSDQTKAGSAGSAALSYSADGDSTIKVGVTTSSARQPTGAYLVRLRLVPLQNELQIGERRTGELAYDSDQTDNGNAVEWFPLSVHANQRIAIAAWSSDFGPTITTALPDGTSLDEEQASDGHAIVRFASPQEGTIRVGIVGDSSDPVGQYTVQVVNPKAPKPIAVGDSANGQLLDGSDMLAGQPMDAYVLAGKNGETVDINLSSSAFDTFLFVQDSTGKITKNDDISADNTNSELKYTFAADGTLEIRVYSAKSDGRGPYQLSVVDSKPDATSGS